MTAAEPVRPRRGLRFEHARFKAHVPGVKVADSPPEVCRVTAVRKGTVYFRTEDGKGSRWYLSELVFPDSVGRVLPDVDPPSPERLRERARAEVEHETSVRTTFVLSCGHILPRSEPIPRREWPVTTPGAVLICDEHEEWALVVEVRTRLVADEQLVTRLFLATVGDETTAAALAADVEDLR